MLFLGTFCGILAECPSAEQFRCSIRKLWRNEEQIGIKYENCLFLFSSFKNGFCETDIRALNKNTNGTRHLCVALSQVTFCRYSPLERICRWGINHLYRVLMGYIPFVDVLEPRLERYCILHISQINVSIAKRFNFLNKLIK
jgi:hypothetical protein